MRKHAKLTIKSALVPIIISAFLIGCATSEPPFKPEVGNPQFREWCRSALSGEKNGVEQKLFKGAFNGDRASTERLFQMALEYQTAGRMRSSDEMWLAWTLETILYRQGDGIFAKVLGTQSPKVQAAVGTFLSSQKIDASFPETARMLRSAPKFDFPLEQAYRESDA